MVPLKVTVVGQEPRYMAGRASRAATAISGLPGAAGSTSPTVHSRAGPLQVTLKRALADSPFLPMTCTACQPEADRSNVCRSRTVTLPARLARRVLMALLVPSLRTQRYRTTPFLLTATTAEKPTVVGHARVARAGTALTLATDTRGPWGAALDAADAAGAVISRLPST